MRYICSFRNTKNTDEFQFDISANGMVQLLEVLNKAHSEGWELLGVILTGKNLLLNNRIF